jgi:hypothetical protein
MISQESRYIIRYKFSKAATSLIAKDLTRNINVIGRKLEAGRKK